MYVCGAAAILKILTPVFKVSERAAHDRTSATPTWTAMLNKPNTSLCSP